MHVRELTTEELIELGRAEQRRRQRIGEKNRGRQFSQESKDNIRAGITRWWAERKAAQAAQAHASDSLRPPSGAELPEMANRPSEAAGVA